MEGESPALIKKKSDLQTQMKVEQNNRGNDTIFQNQGNDGNNNEIKRTSGLLAIW